MLLGLNGLKFEIFPLRPFSTVTTYFTQVKGCYFDVAVSFAAEHLQDFFAPYVRHFSIYFNSYFMWLQFVLVCIILAKIIWWQTYLLNVCETVFLNAFKETTQCLDFNRMRKAIRHANVDVSWCELWKRVFAKKGGRYFLVKNELEKNKDLKARCDILLPREFTQGILFAK